jgi:beta-galactosidase GanA
MKAALRSIVKSCLAASFLGLAAVPAFTQSPALERRGDTTQLIVDGRPFLILGGELANSSASGRAYMAPVWPRLRAMGLNTVVAPVSWELIEPAEGRMDFASMDALIEDARANDLHLVLLWFGAWKNSMSSYAPAWVKRDTARFARVHGPDGAPMEMLSAFDPDVLAADARAFAALMAHLRQVDGARRTVLMVQVENEVGMLPSAREHGPAADAAFAGPVPRGLTDWLVAHRPTLAPPLRALWEANGARREGSWAELFGRGDAAEEIFTAWSYARYVEAVAAAGKAQYRLPMYVNAALARPGRRPGEYPSGGPLTHLFDIWRAGAPSIDLLAPDIYFPNFGEIAAAYAGFNPLFIPEAEHVGDPRIPADAWLAFGRHRAIGFSPFSIDSLSGAEADRLGATYRLIDSFAPLLLDAQRQSRSAGFAPVVAFDGTVDDAPQQATIGDYRFTVTFIDPWTPRAQQRTGENGGLILRTGPEDYLVAGEGITVTVALADGRGAAGIDSAWEGRFENGAWRPGRLLNGDETHQGRHIRLPPSGPSLQRVRLYRYR